MSRYGLSLSPDTYILVINLDSLEIVQVQTDRRDISLIYVVDIQCI